MALTTYTELKASVADWLDRDDLTSQIPDFISLAEDHIFAKARIRVMVTRDNAFVMATRQVNLPSDFLETVRLQLDTDPLWKISYIAPEGIVDLYNSTAGKPEYFTIIGGEIEFNRTPDQSYTGTIIYYKQLDILSDSNSSNALFAKYPGLYLYGALLQAEPFIGNDARLATWASMYTQLLDTANKSSEDATYSGSSLTVRPYGPIA